MNALESAEAVKPVSATENPRPNCRERSACAAKGNGHCRRCFNLTANADPEIRARRSASMKARLSDPHERAIHRRRTCDGIERAKQDPAFIERKREIGRKFGAPNLRATRGPASRAKAGISITSRRLSGIPLAYRDAYMCLKAKGLTAAERREIILRQVERDGRAAVLDTTAAMHAKHQRDLASRY